jgi:hypothetical protein
LVLLQNNTRGLATPFVCAHACAGIHSNLRKRPTLSLQPTTLSSENSDWTLSVRHRALKIKAPFRVQLFRQALRRWYGHHGRDLPWRGTRDPYAILVSEFMLQQTQVATLIPYYKAWLRRFPNFASLARASEDEVLRAWHGFMHQQMLRRAISHCVFMLV